MKKPSITSMIILGFIGLIFSTDTVLLATGIPTISENMSGWIQASNGNLIIFVGGVALISAHWIFGYYKNK